MRFINLLNFRSMKLTDEQLKSLANKTNKCPNCDVIGSMIPQDDAMKMVHSIEGTIINDVEFGVAICNKCAYTSTFLLKLL